MSAAPAQPQARQDAQKALGSNIMARLHVGSILRRREDERRFIVESIKRAERSE